MSSKKAKSNQGNGKQDKGRFSSKRRTEVVLRLLRGEDLEALSREYGVTGPGRLVSATYRDLTLT